MFSNMAPQKGARRRPRRRCGSAAQDLLHDFSSRAKGAYGATRVARARPESAAVDLSGFEHLEFVCVG
ncbi:MAG: hypothetical protein CTY30_08735 [Methylocystis sp.]|nr:MAG: hypothetical protein CTY30_08735 [Methylocystis sp.]